jgi:DNA-binding response OmpR family regulator
MSATLPATETASVLIVEDNADAADSLARFLHTGCGFQVRVAYDGAAGVRSAAADPPHVIVCDIALPRMDGFRVAQAVAALPTRRPLLVAVTAYGGAYPEARARDAGFDHYLLKPADPFAIEALIQAHLQRIAEAGNADE